MLGSNDKPDRSSADATLREPDVTLRELRLMRLFRKRDQSSAKRCSPRI
jgi:hypothetical protein